MVRVKICGITSPADAAVAVAAGAAAIGVNFYPGSPRYVDVDAAEAIVTAVPRGVCRVGVFVNADPATVREIAARLQLDALQFHGDESEQYCRGWRQKVIKAVRVRAAEELARLATYPVDFILADAYVEDRFGGTGQRLPIEWLAGIAMDRLIVAGGLTADNVADLVRRIRPAAVDVASGVERAPGDKDPALVERFIANAQNA